MLEQGRVNHNDDVNATRTISAIRSSLTRRSSQTEVMPVLPSASSSSSIPHNKKQLDFRSAVLTQVPTSLQRNRTAQASIDSTTSVSQTATTTTTDTPKNPYPFSSKILRLPHEQLLFTAGIGGVIGVLATPQIISLGRAIANALSLGSLGIVPQSLGFVGALVVGSSAVKGVRLIVDNYFLKKGR
jgi:hypothetical protein